MQGQGEHRHTSYTEISIPLLSPTATSSCTAIKQSKMLHENTWGITLAYFKEMLSQESFPSGKKTYDITKLNPHPEAERLTAFLPSPFSSNVSLHISVKINSNPKQY